MSNPGKSQPETFWERTGLDWIPVILNEEKFFPSIPGPTLGRIEAIKQQARELEEIVLDDVIVQYEKLTESTKERWEYIESKAGNLINFTTVGSTFIIGFSQLSFDTTRSLMALPLRVTVMGIYIVIAISLFLTITIARKTFAITTSSSPKPSDLLSLRNWNRLYIRQQYVANLLIAHEYNTAIINKKVTYLKGAEKWFGNTIILLLLLLVILAIGLILPSSSAQRTSPDPISIILLTPTPVLTIPTGAGSTGVQNSSTSTLVTTMTVNNTLQPTSPIATIMPTTSIPLTNTSSVSP